MSRAEQKARWREWNNALLREGDFLTPTPLHLIRFIRIVEKWAISGATESELRVGEEINDIFNKNDFEFKIENTETKDIDIATKLNPDEREAMNKASEFGADYFLPFDNPAIFRVLNECFKTNDGPK